MNNLFQKVKSLRLPTFTIPIFLLFLCVISFGLLIPWIGFYWDDWAFAWISQQIGATGLERYFSTNRPVWGLLYQITTPILGETPWHWQVFALVWRWLSAVSLWWLVRLLWPQRKDAALWISMLFLIYPGFTQQHIAITYGHFFMIYTAFLLSLALMVQSIRKQTHFWLWTLPALGLSLLNLLSMEYFFTLELVRPVLIWAAIAAINTDKLELWERFKRTIQIWLPYLAVFIVSVLWRTLFFEYQTQNYDTPLLEQIKTQPFVTIINLIQRMANDIWTASLSAWGRVFQFPNPAELGARTTQLFWLVIAAAAAATIVYLLLRRDSEKEQTDSQKWALPAIGIGIAALLVAGGPFWITQLEVGLDYPNNRFTFPFMLGTSFLIAGILQLIPTRQWPKYVLLGLLISLAVGSHFESANTFRRSWNTQKSLFWQLSWRIPDLEPGTTILANDLPVPYCSDNSLTSPLNWMYSPESSSLQMSYMLYYPTVRLKLGLKDLKPNLPIEQNYLATTFSGNTSQIIAISYEPPACVRVLDSDIEPLNKMIPELMRSSAELSNQNFILPADADQAAAPPASIFGAEPAHNWCYYFEKADLARQLEDWGQVAEFGDEAFTIGDYPNDPTERMPFIEGYAHVGNWDRAIELTDESAAITPLMQPMLCRLWERIDLEVAESPEKTEKVSAVKSALECK